VMGTAGLVAGAELLVKGAAAIATKLGVQPMVIGLTVVACGTSAPVLAVSVGSGLSGNADVAFGNVAGSNIVNILLILGALFIITPVTVAPEVLNFDIWVLAAVTLLAVPVMLTGRRITRIEGAFFVLLYLAFVWYQFDPHKQASFDAAHGGAATAPASGAPAVEAAPARP